MRGILVLASVVLLGTAAAQAQSPDTLYTFAGTGNVQNWVAPPVTSGPNVATLSNDIAGELTVTETGLHDPDNGIDLSGVPMFIHEGYNRVRESSPNTSGGLDATGLSTIELDISHTGTGNINAQFYLALGNNANVYYTAGLPDYTLAPNQTYTLQMPLSGLTDLQRAYIRGFGVQTRDHAAIGNVTWTVKEARVVGTPLTVRDIATHNVGSTDNGLNGAFINFDASSVANGDGGQDQIGLSQNTSGSGSLQWTDIGTNTLATAAGAAISWINGTAFNDNSFFERPTDLSNYNRVTYRMSATDVTPGAGGSIGVQHFFQTASATVDYNYQVAGVSQLPVDGQFHDLVIPINAVTDLRNVQTMGVNIFAHPNDVVINVDNIRYEFVPGVPGDYNGNGVVDAADYVLWRKNGPLQNEVVTQGTVDAGDYAAWRASFGNTNLGGGLRDGTASVPEPSTTGLMLLAIAGRQLVMRRRRAQLGMIERG
jgi:PEP-CTERM motif-containing protein